MFIIRHGKLIVREDKNLLRKLFLSQERIVIETGNAIILEKNGNVTRVVGAGETYLDRDEEIKVVCQILCKKMGRINFWLKSEFS